MTGRGISPVAITRNRSSTIVGNSSEAGPSRPPALGTTPRNITEPTPSLAAAALSSQLGESSKRPRLVSNHTHHASQKSWPSPPSPVITTAPSAPSVPTRGSLDGEGLFPKDRVQLILHTHRPSAANASAHPSSLPSASTTSFVPSMIFLAHQSLPWLAQPGEYLEIRKIRKPVPRGMSRSANRDGPQDESKSGGEALRGLGKRSKGRDGFVFRLGEDCPNVPVGQIQVIESAASAFKFQNRSEIEIVRVGQIYNPTHYEIDHVELRFSQYLGRADMWRLAMSLEGLTLHVGQKLSLAGGAVRAEVNGIWRKAHRHASGILTPRTKTIYRSKSAQTFLFIQVCQETFEFDEDGERYYEKIVHGFLPELFTRWNEKGTSHLVTIIFFARVYYDPDDVTYMEQNGITLGVMTDYAGRKCKDFFRVAIDLERRNDWMLSLSEIKQQLERCEQDMLMDFHLDLLNQNPYPADQKRILGKWSFAYEGNVLEAVNLALNPFDEHYIDRDLSRTGMNITVISPGTGHFAVDKNLLRLTTERMVDHGMCLDLVCLTKMPLHAVPLFSYVSKRPTRAAPDTPASGREKPATPDLLYFDAHLSSATDTELADCYSIPKWVVSTYYSKAHDKPFRPDRFVPRCKMYEIQMMGILDHNLTTVTVPLLDGDASFRPRRISLALGDKQNMRDEFDSNIFQDPTVSDAKNALTTVRSREDSATGSGGVASYQSSRLLAVKAEERRLSPIPNGIGSYGASPKTSSIAIKQPVDSLSPRNRLRDMPPLERSDFQRTELRGASPAPSSLSMGRNRPRSFSRVSEVTAELPSGASTPKLTPQKKLSSKSSKSSIRGRLGANWLLSTLTGRSQPSFPTAAAETVGRQDVSSVTGTRSPSPVSTKARVMPRPVPGAPIVTPSTPSPSKIAHIKSGSDASAPSTQPLPIATRRKRINSDDEIAKSLRNSMKARSPLDSWSKAAAANYARGKSHITVNPCNTDGNEDTGFGEGKRWQHISPKPGKASRHLIQWTSLTTPACLPLTTDFMPSAQEIQEFYELNSYDIACYPDQVSFLVRQDAANTNLPLAVMRELASQRLSQNFQIITLPHQHHKMAEENDPKYGGSRKVLLPGDSITACLRVGGASEVLKDGTGPIYLLWSNHIHRLAFDVTKQSVTIQRFVRRLRHSMEPVKYTCIVWPAQMKGFQEAHATFKYPKNDSRMNFNYLDRLIAGEEEELTSSIRYWRTRYILIPSGKDPLSTQGIVPKGEEFLPSEVLLTGAAKVLELLGRNQWTRPGQTPHGLRLLPTTFDPSACVLDDGLMTELERLNRDEGQIDGGKALEGMTLQTVGEMMCQPNNGLVIRDRWWNFNVHEDSFTGEQFSEWLLNTFSDVKNIDEAAEWGKSLFEKGLIEHVSGAHGFFNYGHFFYRLRKEYDVGKTKRKKPARSWFGGRPTQGPQDLIERHAQMSTSPTAPSHAHAPLGRLGETKPPEGRKKKIKMTQSIVVDLDPLKKSDRAEVVVLHSDIIHNARNAFHFELNWLGVTAGLLDELRTKCAAQAERYGLRFVEAPVEQIKDVSNKCAYRAPIPIRLALAPPVIPDLHLRLTEHGTGQAANFFEYAILTQKFGFVLDVEAGSRYPENIQVEYSYRGKTEFDYSQFCHRSGLALVQCIGGRRGFLWCDNRLFIAAPTRGSRVGVGSTETYPNAPVLPKMTKQEEAQALRAEFEAFCSNKAALKAFYDEFTPPEPGAQEASTASVNGEGGEKKREAEEGILENGESVMSPEMKSSESQH